jgi:hypothetical protein
VRRAALVLLAACSSKPSPPAPPAADASRAAAAAPAAAAPVADRFRIAVDARIELISIVMRLAGADEYRQAVATPYVRAVDAHFAPFREHAAIATTKRLRGEAGISFDAPISLALHLDGVPALAPIRPLAPPPDDLDDRWAKVALEDYLAELRDFARASDFEAFFTAQAPYRAAVEQRFAAVLGGDAVVTWFDGLFGARAGARYLAVPGLLTGGANYGASARAVDGTETILQVVALEDLDAAGLPRPSDATGDLLVHEMAHAYVNPLVERHLAALLPPAQRVFALVAAPMTKQAYPTWDLMVKESIVRAVTALHIKDQRGPHAARVELEAQQDRSFLWIAEHVELLERYRAERARFADLDTFFPEVVKLWEALAARYAASGLPRPTFHGPINAVLRGPGELVLVAPGEVESPALARYVASIRKQFFAKDSFREVRAFASQDFEKKRLVAYGSPASNPIVAALVRRGGWTVDASGISLGGKKFEGRGLVLIACLPNPTDPGLGVLVYTADRDEDLVGVNSVFHGPTDWVVARRTFGKLTIVAQGER